MTCDKTYVNRHCRTDRMKNINMGYINMIMGAVSIILVIIAYIKYPDKLFTEAKNLASTMLMLLPVVIIGLIIASVLSELAMKNFIKDKIQSDSIIVRMIVFILGGVILHGEPVLGLPLILGVKEAGAREEDVISFITSWKMLSISRLPEMIAFINPIIIILYYAIGLITIIIQTLILQMKLKILNVEGK